MRRPLDDHKHIALAVVLLVWGCLAAVPVHAQTPAKKLLREKTHHRLQRIINRSPGITGLAAIDLTTGQMPFAFNADMLFPQASAIKIPILMEVFRQAGQGTFELTDERTVDAENLVGGTGILEHLKGDHTYSIRNLNVYMITLSDNSATNELIDLVSMDSVNEMLQRQGFKRTRLHRKMMAIKASAQGHENLSTPSEAAHIMQNLYQGNFVDRQTSSQVLELLGKTPRRQSRLAAGLPDGVSIAFKPGELQGVSTEWAIVQLDGRPYAVAVMEKYKLEGKAPRVVEHLSKALYEYFWRMGNSTDFGVYRDPDMMD